MIVGAVDVIVGKSRGHSKLIGNSRGNSRGDSR